MEYELGFGKYIKHSDSLLEAIAYEGVEVDLETAEKANALLNRIMTQPYGMLVNLTHKFSFNYEGSLNIGNSPYEKRVAILTFRAASRVAMTTVIQAQKTNFPHKELQFFTDREQAIEWLNALQNSSIATLNSAQ